MNKSALRSGLTLAVSAILLSGCTLWDLKGRTANQQVDHGRDEAIREFSQKVPTPLVNEIDHPYVEFKAVPMRKAPGPLNLRAAASAFGPLMSEVGRANGYSVVFSDAVDTNRHVSVELNGSEIVDGLRTLAYLAGYVAVIDNDSRTITVTDVATFTYKLPANLMQQLTASYTVGGNPVSSSSGSGQGGNSGGLSGSSGSTGSSGSSGSSGTNGGSNGQSGGGSSGVHASFVVAGATQTSGSSVRTLISDLAGKNAAVTVSDLGVITVRANAQSQRRVHTFLKSFAHDAMGQVEIEASIVEVTLDDEFSTGINRNRVLNKSMLGSTGQLNIQTGAVLPNPSLSATFTNSSITSVVTALRQVTDAKVVSNPRIIAINNTPATFFDGTQLPYLGNVVATPSSSGISTTTQLSGSASFAIDGVSFSVQPSIIDDRRVQITIVPVLSNVLKFDTFTLGAGGGTLTAPEQATKQSFMKVMAETGKTLILGGIRYSTDSKIESPALVPLSGTYNRAKIAKEIVILMRATVLPADAYDPLVGESP